MQENTTAEVAKAEVAVKAGEFQATSSGVGKVGAEDAQADLDAIGRMASEGGPNC